LVSGDVAFSGSQHEYGHAKDFLTLLCAQFGRTVEIVWCVPGNHDVDRDCIRKSTLLRDQHATLRQAPTHEIHDRLKEYMEDPQACDLLFRPLRTGESISVGDYAVL
jgi:hypothetical protein